MYVKRDMNLIRRILREVEGRTGLAPLPLDLDDVDTEVVARHAEILIEAGLLDGSAKASGRSHVPTVMVRDLTWAGHDFLATLDSGDVWHKLKNSFKEDALATMPIGILKTVATGLLTKWAMVQAGLE